MTQNELQELFEYRDGPLVWKVGPRTGKVAGSRGHHNYIQLSFKGIQARAHRVVWIMHYGAIPEGVHIDHINRDGSDNRLENLRLVTVSQNLWNRPGNVTKNGFKGVFWDRRRKTWFSKITANGSELYLGSFKTPENAAQAYNFAAYELHGEFRRENKA